MVAENIRKRKLLITLLIITVISFLLGVLFISVLSGANQKLIRTSISGYFDGISKNKMDYLKCLYSVLTSNLLIGSFIWIIGISIIGIFFVVGILVFRSFLLGFSFTSILYTYGFKGIFIGLIYILPEVIGLFIMFLLSYYSISFSILLFNHLFRKKDYNKKVIVSRYLKLLLLSMIGLILVSLVSVFVIPNILRIF